jgi:hypothetical protein
MKEFFETSLSLLMLPHMFSVFFNFQIRHQPRESRETGTHVIHSHDIWHTRSLHTIHQATISSKHAKVVSALWVRVTARLHGGFGLSWEKAHSRSLHLHVMRNFREGRNILLDVATFGNPRSAKDVKERREEELKRRFIYGRSTR